MKNYNKILEAVNRGIQLALDDFDDSSIQNIKSKQVQNRDYTKEYLDLIPYVVDLGLPSKTLWCKYNVGCDWKKLNDDPDNAKLEDWYGGYYAWGETTQKEKYNWSTYIFINNYHMDGVIGASHPAGELNKYVTHPYNNLLDCTMLGKFNDDITQLLPEDDAAYQNIKFHKFKFNIPTKKQLEELIRNTTYQLIHNTNINCQVNGILFTSKINGNQVFIPAGGIKTTNTEKEPICAGAGDYICMWTSSLCDKKPDTAYSLNVPGISDTIEIRNFLRFYGMAIRPVINL